MKRLTLLVMPLLTLSLLASCNKGGGDTPEPPGPEPEQNGLCFTAEEDNSTIAYSADEGLDIDIKTSTDEKTWIDWGGKKINLAKGEKVYVRNTKDTLSNDSNCFSFNMAGKIAASGNVMSMINYANLSEYCFNDMFYDCISLTSAPELPATTLAPYCYNEMFSGCNISQFLRLPATKLAEGCYQGMFAFSGIIEPPNLPATKLVKNCYREMFDSCDFLRVNENGEGTKIFTCPDTTGIEDPVTAMFADMGQSAFEGTPTAGNTYNWYKE